MKKIIKQVAVFFALLFIIISSPAHAQDTEFWFVAPDVDEIYATGKCDSPMRFVLTAGDMPANVTVFYKGGEKQTAVNLAAGETKLVTFARTPAAGEFPLADIENAPANAIVPAFTKNKFGVRITANNPVFASYLADGPCLKDLFTLKGSGALGTEFYLPFQNKFTLTTSSQPNSRRSFHIVATEDNTNIAINLKSGVSLAGCGTHTTVNITLNAGETWAGVGSNAAQQLHGTQIIADKNIAVTVYESTFNGDMIGDQVVPTNQLAKNYIVLRTYPAGRQVTAKEYAFIIATKPNTTLNIVNAANGTSTPVTLASAGDMYELLVSSEYYMVDASEPVYVYHLSAWLANPVQESGASLLPSMYSIQSRGLSFYKSNFSTAGSLFHYIFVITHKDNIDGFLVNGAAGKITASNFSEFRSETGLSDWRYARLQITSWPNGVTSVKNSKGAFSLGYMFGDGTCGGYGYLSGFGDFSFPETTYKCEGQPLILNAGYAKSYKWWKGKDADKPADGSPLILSTSSSYTIPTSEEGYYSVEVNMDPKRVTATTYIKNDILGLSLSSPELIKVNDNASFTATVTRPEGKVFEWVFTGATTPTATGASVSSIQWATTGSKTVTLTVKNPDVGCADDVTTRTVYVYDIQDDYAQALKETPLTIDVLANDDFPGCSTPTLNVPSSTGKGSITVEGGKLKYTPKADALGVDEFTYTVTCGSNTSEAATVRVNIAEKPDNISDADCYINPESKTFTISTPKDYGNGKVNSMSTPLVANLSGNGPEILAPRAYDGSQWGKCNGLVIVNVKANTTREISTVEFAAHGQPVAIADVDKDGMCEIFIQSSLDSKVYCYNPDGSLKSGFTTTQATGQHYIIQLADLNADGNVELVAGPYIFNAKTGTLILHMPSESGGTGYCNPRGLNLAHQNAPYGGYYFMPAIGDIDGDGIQEVVGGGIVYKPNSTLTAYTTVKVNTTATPAAFKKWRDGPTVLVDFDNDGKLDVCVIGYQQYTGGTAFQFYVWNPRSRELIAYATDVAAGGYGITIPYVGDLDKNGYPDFAFGRTNIGMMSYQYDSSKPGNISQGPTFAASTKTAGFTMFDFNLDGKSDIVYRGSSSFYIVNLKNDGSGYEDLTDPTTTYSGTAAEYPIVADVDEDGQAEIILTRAPEAWNSTNLQGMVSVYKAGDAHKPWAYARKVWNQWAYNGVNINEDMTVPKYPISPAMRFPNGRQPFNGFLMQATVHNANGDIIFLVPEASFDGIPAYTWNSAEDKLEIKVKVKNIGDASLVAPVYATAYKNSVLPASKLATGSCATNIAPNTTGEITITIPNISAKLPITEIHIRINDDGSSYPVQKQCKYDSNLNNRPLAGMPRAVNDTIQVRSNILYTDNDIIGNDTYSCSPSDLSVSIVPPISTNAATASINAGKKLDYQSIVGFGGDDKIYYKIQCSGSEDASIAISHMVIYKPVRVVIVSGLDSADESGTLKAKLRFEFTDNVTHTKKVEVSYSVTPDGENELQSPAPPAPYKVVIPIGQRSVDEELIAKQNYVVQGNRDITVTITEVKEVP